MAYSGPTWTNVSNSFTVAVNGTVISPSDADAFWADLSGGMNSVILRNGAAPFTGPQLFADGGVSTPSFAFNSESNTGLYRPTASELGVSIVGTQVALFSSSGITATGVTTTGTVTAGTLNITTGALQVNGSSGNLGQILMSGGSGALPIWSSILSAVVQNEGSLGSGTTTIDWTAGDTIQIVLDGSALTLAFSNTPGAGFSQTLTIVFIQDATGSRPLPTFSSTIKWDGGIAPVLTTTANKTDIIQIMAVNVGGTTTFYGAQILGNA